LMSNAFAKVRALRPGFLEKPKVQNAQGTGSYPKSAQLDGQISEERERLNKLDNELKRIEEDISRETNQFRTQEKEERKERRKRKKFLEDMKKHEERELERIEEILKSSRASQKQKESQESLDQLRRWRDQDLEKEVQKVLVVENDKSAPVVVDNIIEINKVENDVPMEYLTDVSIPMDEDFLASGEVGDTIRVPKHKQMGVSSRKGILESGALELDETQKQLVKMKKRSMLLKKNIKEKQQA